VGKKVYFSILIFIIIWNGMNFAAPLLIDKGGIFTYSSEFIYGLFSRTCHQIDSRSFHIAGFKLAVCSRCVSVYLSFFIGCLVYPMIKKLDNKILPSLWFLMIPFALLMLDVGLDLLDILENTFISRSITGGLMGFVLPFYLIPGFVNFLSEVRDFFSQKKELNIKKKL
jgi:uncharacterized membrane protein